MCKREYATVTNSTSRRRRTHERTRAQRRSWERSAGLRLTYHEAADDAQAWAQMEDAARSSGWGSPGAWGPPAWGPGDCDWSGAGSSSGGGSGWESPGWLRWKEAAKEIDFDDDAWKQGWSKTWEEDRGDDVEARFGWGSAEHIAASDAAAAAEAKADCDGEEAGNEAPRAPSSN
ncbi:hypothetical protein R3P38DRAFT_3235626 [Favolaschia claudopus]|uniref:Uncharacterized protein n=1 Tax=Favolaschia claudopus TaxID=2862362 RepID=A0AAV9ZEF5_9AGAR